MTNYWTGGPDMNIKTIVVRAIVTAAEALLATLLATGLTDLSPEATQTALIAAAAAGLSVIYNALRQYLDVTDA